jgi:hypothetical protein
MGRFTVYTLSVEKYEDEGVGTGPTRSYSSPNTRKPLAAMKFKPVFIIPILTNRALERFIYAYLECRHPHTSSRTNFISVDFDGTFGLFLAQAIKKANIAKSGFRRDGIL